jgi:hypothetical protein
MFSNQKAFIHSWVGVPLEKASRAKARRQRSESLRSRSLERCAHSLRLLAAPNEARLPALLQRSRDYQIPV